VTKAYSTGAELGVVATEADRAKHDAGVALLTVLLGPGVTPRTSARMRQSSGAFPAGRHGQGRGCP
jgi:hypothetical protein